MDNRKVVRIQMDSVIDWAQWIWLQHCWPTTNRIWEAQARRLSSMALAFGWQAVHAYPTRNWNVSSWNMVEPWLEIRCSTWNLEWLIDRGDWYGQDMDRYDLLWFTMIYNRCRNSSTTTRPPSCKVLQANAEESMNNMASHMSLMSLQTTWLRATRPGPSWNEEPNGSTLWPQIGLWTAWRKADATWPWYKFNMRSVEMQHYFLTFATPGVYWGIPEIRFSAQKSNYSRQKRGLLQDNWVVNQTCQASFKATCQHVCQAPPQCFPSWIAQQSRLDVSVVFKTWLSEMSKSVSTKLEPPKCRGKHGRVEICWNSHRRCSGFYCWCCLSGSWATDFPAWPPEPMKMTSSWKVCMEHAWMPNGCLQCSSKQPGKDNSHFHLLM